MPIAGTLCGGGPQLASPPEVPPQAGAGDQTASGSAAEERCIFYDKDGRRIELAPQDRAWAEDAGLVADKKCY